MKNINKAGAAIWLSFILSFSLHAQTINTPPAIVWQKCFGGTEDEVANCVRLTSENGFVVAGTSNSNDGDISGNHGGNDFSLIKLSENGTVICKQLAMIGDKLRIIAPPSYLHFDPLTGERI